MKIRLTEKQPFKNFHLSFSLPELKKGLLLLAYFTQSNALLSLKKDLRDSANSPES